MREKDVKDQLFEDFAAWIHGQTIGFYDDDGSPNFYDRDVQRYRSLVHRLILHKTSSSLFFIPVIHGDEAASDRVDSLVKKHEPKPRDKKILK